MQHNLKIERIECIPLSMELPRTFKGSSYFMTHRCTIITRVYTSDGIIGEIYNGDEFEIQKEIVDIIINEIQPLIVGMSAFNTAGCWDRIMKPSRNILRDRKLAMCAIACVDSAIWDCVGKALDVPLYKIWGGARETLPIVCIAGYYEEGKTDSDLAREVESIRDSGFCGMKFKVGGLSPHEDAARVRIARDAGGEDFTLLVDANQGWTVRQAITFAELAQDSGIRWFEEPVGWENDREDMATVRAISGIPVCAGQSEISGAACRDLIMAKAVDVCNFDASWGGGPTEWLRVAALAQTCSVQMGHHEEPQVSAHLLAAVQNGTFLETFHPDRDPLFYRLVANRSEISQGHYRVPDGPGFGVKLDEKVIEKYRVT